MTRVLTQTPMEVLNASSGYTFVLSQWYDVVASRLSASPVVGRMQDWLLYDEECASTVVHRSELLMEQQQQQEQISDNGESHSHSVIQRVCSVIDPVVSQVVMLHTQSTATASSQHGSSTIGSTRTSQSADLNVDPSYRESTVASAYAYANSNIPESRKELDESMFISQIAEVKYNRPESMSLAPTPNVFDLMKEKNALPSTGCIRCFQMRKRSGCRMCRLHCMEFCGHICHTPAPPLFIGMEVTVKPPRVVRDAPRHIPRIVHQTWFETVDPAKYPNLSRMVQSFKHSGWDYRFYTDDDVSAFLSTHFPAPVVEAYDALIPGAFKADLFRYCVLLIHGGVYADVDVMLESNLDVAIPADVSFMVPIDEPGIELGRQMCLWNGFMASSPGHVFLAQAIETVVNQVRNRFTSVDIDASFCPDPLFRVLHRYDTLYTAGPCLLGTSVNRALQRDASTSFAPGVLDVAHGSAGRTVILRQDKNDMGAHRFTNMELNLVMAATDLANAENRPNREKKVVNLLDHYTKIQAGTGIYGLEGLYRNATRANENIRMVVEAKQ
jgi:hypothetical protein